MIGKQVIELPTPSLLLDIEKMEHNLKAIASFTEKLGISWRPHIKTHKSIEIAKRQQSFGARGITVAKVSEAEVMAAGKMNDILIAYPIASRDKLQRVQKLLHTTHVILTVDSRAQAQCIQDYFSHSEQQVEVWIKINSGLNRCGVEPGMEALDLAKQITMMPNLNLTGMFTHAGHAYGAKTVEEIERIGRYEGESVVESAKLCHSEGIVISNRSVGSTPTFQISGRAEGITEVRPGNAVFFDAIQVGLGVASVDQCGLAVLSSVMGVYKDRIVFDSGSKTLSLDKGAHGNQSVLGHGIVINHPDVILERLSEEHGVASFSNSPRLKLSDKVEIIPNHACTVVNLFDSIVVHRQGKVIDEWIVDARGKNQ